MSQISRWRNIFFNDIKIFDNGNAFNTLNFYIFLENQEVAKLKSSNLNEVLGYFDDFTLDFGEWTELLVGDFLDLKIQMDFIFDEFGEGFAFDLIAGNSLVGSNPAPLPSSFWLLASAVLVLVRMRRSNFEQVDAVGPLQV